jgi:hypothetical protein
VTREYQNKLPPKKSRETFDICLRLRCDRIVTESRVIGSASSGFQGVFTSNVGVTMSKVLGGWWSLPIVNLVGVFDFDTAELKIQE